VIEDSPMAVSATPMRPLPSGFQVHWYEIRDVLGQGAFGVTYRAQDGNLDREVAIKEYCPRAYAARARDGEVGPATPGVEEMYRWGLGRFLDEARTLARFRHPAIVRVASAFEANGTAYMVMELEHGSRLDDLLERGQCSDEPSLLRLIHPLLDGLEHIHAAGFIHRDIKPENVLLRESGAPVLLDFGAARRALRDGAGRLTAVLTEGYAPFEQHRTGDADLRQGPWTDIYSIAAIACRALTGALPPDALARAAALLEGEADPLEPLAGRVPSACSGAFLSAVDAALAFKPGERPRSVAAWRQRLPPPPAEPVRLVAPAPADAPGAAPEASPAAPTEPRPGACAAVPDPALASLDVLVVDDEAFVLSLIRRTLLKLGVEHVDIAEDGARALETIAERGTSPDMILLDLGMPGMDGVEVLRHLGERGISSAIVLVSGAEGPVLRAAEALARSHDLYLLGALRKPVRPAPLAALLGAFERGRARSANDPLEPIGEAELEAGLGGDAVEAVFQPKVTAAEGTLVGVEALARWRHPTRGILAPAAFIAVAEEAERIGDLTDAVLRQTLGWAGRWQAAGLDLDVAVNLSIDSLKRLDLPERVVARAADEGVAPSRLTLEVTESRLMRDVRAPLEILARLRLKGVRLSIDDFGTGYSSLEQLKRVPFTELKIDRAFVHGAARDPSARALLESSVALGKRLDLALVAEGVEDRADWDLVAALGCDEVQGYFVARPMAGDVLVDWAGRWSGRSRGRAE